MSKSFRTLIEDWSDLQPAIRADVDVDIAAEVMLRTADVVRSLYDDGNALVETRSPVLDVAREHATTITESRRPPPAAAKMPKKPSTRSNVSSSPSPPRFALATRANATKRDFITSPIPPSPIAHPSRPRPRPERRRRPRDEKAREPHTMTHYDTLGLTAEAKTDDGWETRTNASPSSFTPTALGATRARFSSSNARTMSRRRNPSREITTPRSRLERLDRSPTSSTSKRWTFGPSPSLLPRTTLASRAVGATCAARVGAATPTNTGG